MGLSSTGIGSGLQVEDIVSKLVALERQPIAKLQSVALSMQTKLSIFSQVKSMMSTLSDAAAKLSKNSTWGGMVATSSNSAAVSVSVIGAASATSFGIGVQQLARAQSAASASLGAPGASVGGGSLSIQLGTWTGTDTASPQFTEGAAGAVPVQIDAGDSLATIASKINGAKAGVTATVLRDANGERLLVRSDSTGASSGFRIRVTEDGAAPGLSNLAFDPQGAPGAGMAANAIQYAQNAQATVNGIAVESATNTFTDTIPGLSFTASQITTAPVEVAVGSDTETLKKNIQDFVNAYNGLNDLLGASTKYDSASKTAGALQGDGTTVALQNTLRSMIASTAEGTGAFQRLADIGIDIKTGGKLEVSADKLDAALKNPEALKALFATNVGSGSQANGLAVKMKALADQMLLPEGLLDNKASALGASIKRNKSDQDRVDERASIMEKRLRAQYTALDAKMASLSGLGAYVGQQVSQWNRTNN
ncbi:flagellar hook-associated 2 domain protein [Acidovorax sp. JS42]|uniref:flagellar filament capping protein FliD n=1 Tax=Diaphorobacter sp. JS3051 TaxID=2792224 RepID=UPI0000DCA254|nr:flagellar filament capping protein FliD [Diaphorobacter sp. JS3051]ABM43918.1 flagellar hook-associated 2 domain protein [Acidovorax sp. JS42]QPN30161.1 flagellar filament capping protein FliD [Diaphorobacter sp. JS3051]